MKNYKVILLILIIFFTNILLLFYCENVFPKQYNINSYHKTRIIDGKECKQFYSYYNGKEHLINVICD